jgi:lipopolysaccharide/colanic/teichoic acid biosynthesis glycosyltransferase
VRALDVVVALLGLVLLAPLSALVAIVILLESRGGVLFAAERVGQGGTPFTMWKLRTMHDAPGAPVAARGDPRVTGIGRLLRWSGFDEWPQLWNVLRGDMSLVGPRPEDPALVDLEDPRWVRVLSVRPGITGPTQLVWAPREAAVLRGPEPLETYRRDVLPAKLRSDERYVAERSVRGNLRVLAATLLCVAGDADRALRGRRRTNDRIDVAIRRRRSRRGPAEHRPGASAAAAARRRVGGRAARA